MKNCKLLMRICSHASAARDVPMMHSMRFLKFHPYIYGGEPSKSMKLPIDSFSVTQSFFPLLRFPPSPASIGLEGGEVMEGGFQQSLPLFVTNEYCVFEDDICVDLLDVLDGKPDYANSPLLEFFVRARCPPILAPSGVVAVKVYG